MKSFALVNALECADKKFDEINDGIIYGASAALGFVLVENILYLQNAGNEFWLTFAGRSFYTAMAHMIFTAIFGLYYAQAYLGPLVGKERKKRRAPLAFLAMTFKAGIEKIPTKKRSPLRILWAIFCEIFSILTLHITRHHILFHNSTRGHWAGEILLEGFLLAYYLHIAFDKLLESSNFWLNNLALAGCVIIFGLVVMRFKSLEDQN